MACTVTAVALSALAACTDADNPIAPRAVLNATLEVNTDSIKLSYLCGNRFRIRSYNDAPADVKWQVVQTADTGRLALPGRGALPYTEAVFSTSVAGTTHLFYTNVEVDSAAHGATQCAALTLVPSVSPDTLPASVYDTTNIILGGPENSLRYLRGIVQIGFKPGTSQADRQAAIDLIGGAVIGGVRTFGTDGIYYVRVADDGTPGPQLRAAARVAALAQVSFASAAGLDGLTPSYRTPNDGGGAWSTWQTSRSLATGANWALEAIDAPLAWGCSVGSNSVHVAVIDQGLLLDNIPDLQQDSLLLNINADNASAADQHGTMVASQLAAVGDNQIGMTGVMWKARLELDDIYAHPVDIGAPQPLAQPSMTHPTPADVMAWHIYMAGHRGARVINLSFSLQWGQSNPQRGDSAVEDRLRAGRQVVSAALGALQAEGKTPLVVVAAGNDGLDAAFGGSSLAVLDFPGQVIVVGGSTQAGARLPLVSGHGSNHGSLIDVYAPGENVAGYSRSGSISVWTGTSFAAPLVSGVAGLVLAFDADAGLTSAQVKQRILNGGRGTVDGKPLLNAYGALEEAAKRTGAPLCDNRVWYASGQVWARRDRTNPASDEALFSIPSSDSAGIISPAHGGKRVDAFSSTTWDYLAFEYSSGTWTKNDDYWSLPYGVDGGATNSFFSYSHTADTSASASVGSDGAIHVRRRLEHYPYANTEIASFSVSGVPTASADSVCLFRYIPDHTQCGYRVIGTGGRVTATTAFAPNGQEILVAVNIATTSLTSDSDYFECIDDHECRQLGLTTTTVGSQLWTVPIAGGSAQLRWSLTGRYIMQLAESEAGTEVVAHLAADSSASVTGAFIITPSAPESPYPVIQTRGGDVVWSRCSTAFFGFSSSTPLQEITTPDTCPIWPGPISTVSPRIAASGRGAIQARSESPSSRRARVSHTRSLAQP